MSRERRAAARTAVWTSAFAALAAAAMGAPTPGIAAEVSHRTASVNGVLCDVWTWSDAHGRPRTVALKLEGRGNPGHGGYAVRMTYDRLVPTALHPSGAWRKVTVDAPKTGDGGFGYFVSHERYRNFKGGVQATIASYVFHTDDSPLGLRFAARRAIVLDRATAGAERFTIEYGHYGTRKPWAIDPDTGLDTPPLPKSAGNFAFYPMPVATTWVFEAGHDFPRIDVAVDLSQVAAPGTAAPDAGLVSFDLRGPYGVLAFDNDADGLVGKVAWGDRTNLFATTRAPATRSSRWSWKAANKGARYHVLTTGTPDTAAGRFEIGLFEPASAATSALADGYAAERRFDSAGYAAAVTAGQQPPSLDSCFPQARQRLPSDGDWPYQSLQYSLPCPPVAHYLTTPTDGKKIAWGSSAYYGSTLTSVWNGYKSLPIDAFPANHRIAYSLCLVLGWNPNDSGPAPVFDTHTAANAALYTKADPHPANTGCATAAVP